MDNCFWSILQITQKSIINLSSIVYKSNRIEPTSSSTAYTKTVISSLLDLLLAFHTNISHNKILSQTTCLYVIQSWTHRRTPHFVTLCRRPGESPHNGLPSHAFEVPFDFIFVMSILLSPEKKNLTNQQIDFTHSFLCYLAN